MLDKIKTLSPLARTAAIVLVLSAMLGSIIMHAERLHRTGVSVVLATAPVDPRSLFQGDYVVLSYEISRLDEALFNDEESSMLSTVYVELKKGEPVWTPVRASVHSFEPAPGNVVLKGNRDYSGRITYGIESFFVPENDGYAVERMGWSERSRLTVRIKVAPDGTPIMDNLLIDGVDAYASGGLRIKKPR